MRGWAASAYLKSSARQNMGSLNVKESLPVDRKKRVSSVLGFGRVERRPELDALRGVFLVWMTLTHQPTHLTGNLKDWERWDRLHEIKVRTLTIDARYDEMDPEDMKKMATLMPNATSAICPNGSHMCFWDDQEVYFHHLLGFLRTV
jgi:pimeloyl-ACP methyl ester carboxylesterase